jgi:hypothetical protein
VSHRNSRGFGRINSCVPKALTGKILVRIESYEIPMFFLHSKGGLNPYSIRVITNTHPTPLDQKLKKHPKQFSKLKDRMSDA